MPLKMFVVYLLGKWLAVDVVNDVHFFPRLIDFGEKKVENFAS